MRLGSILMSLLIAGCAHRGARHVQDAPCDTSPAQPPVLTVVVTGTTGRVAGAVVSARIVNGGWTSTAVTNGTGEATFRPQQEGVYYITLTCEVAGCGSIRHVSHAVTLQGGASTSTLLSTDALVIY